VSDMHDDLNELARRGTPRGFDHVLAGAADAAAADARARDVRGDDLDVVPLVMPEPNVRRRRPLGSAIAAAGVAALVLVGAFAVSAVVGSGGGAGSPESAVRQLADAISHEDPLAAADVLAPDEVHSLSSTLSDAEKKAADLQLVRTAGAPLAGVDFNVSGLKLTTDSLGDGYAEVTVDAGTFTASTHKAQFSALMQKVLRNAHDNSASDDLARLAASKNLPTFVVTVRQNGHWYVSAAYTVLEYIREDGQLPAADFGSGEHSVSSLGAASPDAAVQESLRAIQSRDWSKLMTMMPPSEIPVYDYRAAVTALIARHSGPDSTKPSFTIDALSTSSKVSGNTAKVTLKASGTTDSGRWSIDGGCFVPPTSPDQSASGVPCIEGSYLLAPLVLRGETLNRLTGITTVEQDGRWFVSPIGSVLDVVDQFVNQLDRRSLFTLLNIPNEIPPDGALTLGRPVTLPATAAYRGATVLTFDGHKGEKLLGLGASKSRSANGNGPIDVAYVRVFAPDGAPLDQAAGILDGEPLTLPSDGRYIFAIQLINARAGDGTVTIWDAADAPAAANQSRFGASGSTCTYGTDGSETCTSTAVTVPAIGSGATIKQVGQNGGGSYGTAYTPTSVAGIGNGGTTVPETIPALLLPPTTTSVPGG
jgi:hypothetical protein